MGEILLEGKSLTKVYGDGGGAVHALRAPNKT